MIGLMLTSSPDGPRVGFRSARMLDCPSFAVQPCSVLRPDDLMGPLGPVDTYLSQRTMAASVMTAR